MVRRHELAIHREHGANDKRSARRLCELDAAIKLWRLEYIILRFVFTLYGWHLQSASQKRGAQDSMSMTRC